MKNWNQQLRQLGLVLAATVAACGETTSGDSTSAPTSDTSKTESASDTIDTSGSTGETTHPTDDSDSGGAPVGQATFVLSGDAYDDVAISWSDDDGNLVFCNYYTGPDSGDYLWIRFAESPEEDGQTSPHLDLDVCRFSEGGLGGNYTAMVPTEVAANCKPEPGWGIWWHEGEVAYNNDPTASECSLAIEVDGSIATGTFTCASLPEIDGNKGLAVREGSFTCDVVGM